MQRPTCNPVGPKKNQVATEGLRESPEIHLSITGKDRYLQRLRAARSGLVRPVPQSELRVLSHCFLSLVRCSSSNCLPMFRSELGGACRHCAKQRGSDRVIPARSGLGLAFAHPLRLRCLKLSGPPPLQSLPCLVPSSGAQQYHHALDDRVSHGSTYIYSRNMRTRLPIWLLSGRGCALMKRRGTGGCPKCAIQGTLRCV